MVGEARVLDIVWYMDLVDKAARRNQCIGSAGEPQHMIDAPWDDDCSKALTRVEHGVDFLFRFTIVATMESRRA